MPDPATWDYTFDHLAEIVDGSARPSGSPGRWASTCRTTAARSATASSPSTRNGCSGRSSRTPTPTKKASPKPGTASATRSGSTAAPRTEAPLEAFLQPETVKAIYTTGHPDPSKISPDNWNTDLFFLSRPARPSGAAGPVLRLPDQRRAVPDAGRQSLRERQPLTLIFWGQGDIFFTPAGGEAYLRDLPDAELVRLDSGHFAVEDHLEQIADGIMRFYDTRVGPAVHAVTG